MNALEFLLNIKYAGVTPVTSFDWTPIFDQLYEEGERTNTIKIHGYKQLHYIFKSC